METGKQEKTRDVVIFYRFGLSKRLILLKEIDLKFFKLLENVKVYLENLLFATITVMILRWKLSPNVKDNFWSLDTLVLKV